MHIYIKAQWQENDSVRVKASGKVGIARYIYTNGFTLVEFPDTLIKGGLFNNDSTFHNSEIESIGE